MNPLYPFSWWPLRWWKISFFLYALVRVLNVHVCKRLGIPVRRLVLPRPRLKQKRVVWSRL